ncbi:MAG: hypothetical protein K8J08_22180 [Thermoanaerobaculia bacterium]|nr:hypothetical protein [Thermoanaerobaculia bacterium]
MNQPPHSESELNWNRWTPQFSLAGARESVTATKLSCRLSRWVRRLPSLPRHPSTSLGRAQRRLWPAYNAGLKRSDLLEPAWPIIAGTYGADSRLSLRAEATLAESYLRLGRIDDSRRLLVDIETRLGAGNEELPDLRAIVAGLAEEMARLEAP